MKTIWFTLMIIVLGFNVSAAQFIEGKQYIKLNNNYYTEHPQVIEFFSFYCSHCYEFEQVYRLSSKIKQSMPDSIQVSRYHVDFLGPMGQQLTHAWTVAIALGVEDQISQLMFDAVQKTHTIQKEDDIRAIFNKIGINDEEYNSAWNSLVVKCLLVKQKKAVEQLSLIGVPAIVINGKYIIKNDGLDMSSIFVYTNQLNELVNFLLTH